MPCGKNFDENKVTESDNICMYYIIIPEKEILHAMKKNI